MKACCTGRGAEASASMGFNGLDPPLSFELLHVGGQLLAALERPVIRTFLGFVQACANNPALFGGVLVIRSR